jgi:hypothetical protein
MDFYSIVILVHCLDNEEAVVCKIVFHKISSNLVLIKKVPTNVGIKDEKQNESSG